MSQVQRLGRQILEALLFLKERGFPLHGHLHSGNVILQNGAARWVRCRLAPTQLLTNLIMAAIFDIESVACPPITTAKFQSFKIHPNRTDIDFSLNGKLKAIPQNRCPFQGTLNACPCFVSPWLAPSYPCSCCATTRKRHPLNHPLANIEWV